MADLYVSDSVFSRYVAEYGADDAKKEMRDVLEEGAPGDSDE